MSEIIVYSSSNSDNWEIDEYHDSSSDSGSSGSNSSSSGSSSSGGNTTDEQYTSGVPMVPLEVLQEELRTRMASRIMVTHYLRYDCRRQKFVKPITKCHVKI